MRLMILLLPLVLLLPACGDTPSGDPAVPTYLGADAATWAKNITSPELRKQEAEMNRLALGRIEVIPILMVLLDHEDPEVVFGAFSALEGNMAKVERANGDPAPWIPLLKKSAAMSDESISRSATALLAKHEKR